MSSRLKKVLPAVAVCVVGSLAAFGLGVVSSQQPITPPASGVRAASEALTTSGTTVQLTSSQLDEAEENAKPLDPEDAKFTSNMDLTEEEVTERSLDLGASYDIGESVTLEDLEFLRIYAFSTTEPSTGAVVASGPATGDGPVISAAISTVGPSIELASAQTTNFNVSKTLAGTEGNITGSVTGDVGAGLTSSWTSTWTAKKVSGTSTTKIVSQAHSYGYGLTNVAPFVGLIYEAHPSGKTTGQSLVFSRTANFTGVTYYMTLDAVSTFYNAAGSFQISAF